MSNARKVTVLLVSRRWRGRPLVMINYRSVDEPWISYVLYEELVARFGEDAVFRDCNSIPPGLDFQPQLLEAVRECAVLLVIIGPRWLDATNEDGSPLIQNPDDWVRREIVEAFRHGVRVVPVLFGNVPRLDQSDLPAEISAIANRQYCRLHHRHERQDIANLVELLMAEEPRLYAQGVQSRSPVRAPVPANGPAGWRSWANLGIAVLAVGLALVLAWLIATGRTAGTESAVIGGLAVIVGMVALVARRLVPANALPATPARLDAAAELLAQQVFQQASDAIAAWQIDGPKILTRWQFTLEDGFSRSIREWASGDAYSVTQLARWVNSLPRLRLAILGAAGCGKTSLAMQLVRELAGRHALGDPVPVLVPLAGWDSETKSLHGWLASRLVKDHPSLLASEFGRDAAGELLRARRIIPVLDGFDELTPQAQQAAMRVLSRLSDHDGWIITSRTSAFDELPAVERAAFDATLAARPLSAAEVAAYLRRLVRDEPRWLPIFRRIDEAPHSALAVALRTPLTLWLIRSTYIENDADPAPLAAFGNAEDLQRHLLRELVPSLVTNRAAADKGRATAFLPYHHWRPDRTRRWLTNLAMYLTMHETTELSWWTLTDLAPRRPRLVLGLVTSLLVGLLGGGISVFIVGSTSLIPTVALAICFGMSVSVCVVDRTVPRLASFRLRGRMGILLARLMEGSMAGLIMIGLILIGGYLGNLMAADFTNQMTPTVAMLVGSWIGLGFGISRWATTATRLDAAWTPADMLRADRRLTLFYVFFMSLLGISYTTYLLARPYGTTAGVMLALATLPGWVVWGAFMPLRPAAPPQIDSRASGHASSNYALSVGWAAASRLLPWRLMPFMVDMHRLGILKQVGAAYQFRHVELQAVLTDDFLLDRNEE